MKHMIFDMDGVIIDSEPIHTALDIKMLAGYGIEISAQEIEKFIGISSKVTWEILKNRFQLEATVDELVEESIQLKLHNLSISGIKPITGIVTLLNTVRDLGIPMAVASSSPESYIKEVLKVCGIHDYFTHVVSGQHVANSKPAPDIFLKTAELLGAKPQECIVIEDSTHGISAAKVAGMYCVGFDNVNSKNQVLDQADMIVQRISEIVIDKLTNSI
ncbi:MAG: HAD family phosphatase [Vallitaleaceae bacterium]|jgi:HAD superfamily hydrolase (TIGR01509 family)|nr:HAD family phosphatase [Vallitaleaceae bacterium]